MDWRNDSSSPSGRRDARGRRRSRERRDESDGPWSGEAQSGEGRDAAGGPWSGRREAKTGGLPVPGPWSRWNRPATSSATLATPLSWIGGSLLLTATTFLVSGIALIRAIVALFD